jgi:molecular chaperone DnaK
MVNEAEKHADEDKRRRELIELKNQSDSLAYSAEKTINELGEQVDSIQRDRITGLVGDLRDAVSKEDEDRMRSVSAELQQELYKVSQSAYGDQQGGQGGQGGQPGGGQQGGDGKDSGVVEGEYTVE